MIYYNEMFNIDVVVDDSNLSLPIFKNHDTGKVYKPFLKWMREWDVLSRVTWHGSKTSCRT